MDHLVGKLFVDYLSPLKRQRIRHKKLKSSIREEQKRDNSDLLVTGKKRV